MAAMASLAGCIEDGFSSSAADQPVFSVDTLQMGVIFTEQPSATFRFTVYNPSKKSLNISQVSLSGSNADLFRLNVDGFSGSRFSDVEIRANDSIFVFVETTLPSNGASVPVEIDAQLDFVTMGVTRSVVVAAQGRDVKRLSAVTLSEDTTFPAGQPYLVMDSLVVAPGATLTIEPGAEMLFHDGASMVVRGSLRAVGRQGSEITFAGDRTGYVAADISFDIMSRQWAGIFFTSTSRDNELSYVHVCNTWQGVTVDGTGSDQPVELLMTNSRLRNAGYRPLEMYHANLTAYGCEIAEGGEGALLLHGGSHHLDHCTLANYYLFAVPSSPILTFSHLDAETDDLSGLPYTSAEITNTIVYGLGTDLSHGDFTGMPVTFRSCLFKSAGSDDDNFIDCLWGEDPEFQTVREEYVFDYRLSAESPARTPINAAPTPAEAATDRLGTPRASALGAYETLPE